MRLCFIRLLFRGATVLLLLGSALPVQTLVGIAPALQSSQGYFPTEVTLDQAYFLACE
jgi:hypothetical protein